MAINNFTGSSNQGGSSQGGNPFAGMLNSAQTGFDPESVLINYNDKFKKAPVAMFRDNLVAQTMSVLIGKNKPNALLIGMAGTGKTKIVEDVARRIANNDPSLPLELSGSTIYELPLSSLVAGAGIVGELEERLEAILEFCIDPKNNAILFIDEIHQLAKTTDTTYTKIAQVLKPALARGDLRTIGATTSQEAKTLMGDPAFNRRFSRIIVDELSREQTVKILEMSVLSFVKHYSNKIYIDTTILEELAIIADSYGNAGNHRPDNAITLLDRACGNAVVERKAKEVQFANDPKLLQTLKSQPIAITSDLLHKTALIIATGHAKQNKVDIDVLKEKLEKIKGQDEAVNALVSQIARRERGLFPMEKPLAMLFAGPSGVGKTEVVKILSQYMTEMKPIILNMTEYHSSASINRIIGSPMGYIGSDSNKEFPFDKLDTNPYQVILLDEFEKADKAVQRLFMGALDEGFITMAQGNTIDFSKAIIIATTNAGHSAGKSVSIGINTGSNKSKNSNIIDLSRWFDTELLNRFTETVTFNAIEKDTYIEILKDIYEKEMARIKAFNRRITMPDTLSDADAKEIADKTYAKSFGARPAYKAVQAYIEDNA